MSKSSQGSHQSILILDFGAQYTQLIARRIREQAVYCEIHPFNVGLDKIRAMAPTGIPVALRDAGIDGSVPSEMDADLVDLDERATA